MYIANKPPQASAAAPITQETIAFFQSLDIPVYEIYGMSECSGPQTLSFDGKFGCHTPIPLRTCQSNQAVNLTYFHQLINMLVLNIVFENIDVLLILTAREERCMEAILFKVGKLYLRNVVHELCPSITEVFSDLKLFNKGM